MELDEYLRRDIQQALAGTDEVGRLEDAVLAPVRDRVLSDEEEALFAEWSRDPLGVDWDTWQRDMAARLRDARLALSP